MSVYIDRAEIKPFTAVIINYNGREVLADTICALKSLQVPPVEYILVDDGSTDDSIAFVRRTYPQIKIVELPQNTGRTSIVRNAGLRQATERYVLVTDNDIAFKSDAVNALFDVMLAHGDAAACTPAVLFNDGSGEVCALGHQMHFLCWSQARPQETLAQLQAKGPIHAVGCGIALFDKTRLTESGYFNENMVIGWGDDGELHHRLRMMGAACYSVPTAVAFHNRIRAVPRIHGMVHNRLVFLASNYQTRTLILLGPVLIGFEMLLMIYTLLKGQLPAYLKGWKTAYKARHEILADRNRLQHARRVDDMRLLQSGMLDLPLKTAKRPVRLAVGAMVAVLNGYWSAIKIIAAMGRTEDHPTMRRDKNSTGP